MSGHESETLHVDIDVGELSHGRNSLALGKSGNALLGRRSSSSLAFMEPEI